MRIDTSQLSNDQLIEIVQSFDRQGLPLERRFKGDDQAIRDLMCAYQIQPLAANIAIVLTVILREATIRGLTIPTVN